jgi:hypothetical protein
MNNKQREQQWKEGLHTDQNDRVITIEKMTDDHLLRTMNMFSSLQVKPLRRVYRKRWRRRVNEVIDFMRREEQFRVPSSKEKALHRQATKARKVLEKYLSLKL